MTDSSLPINQRFATLDEFLEYRRRLGWLDDYWYREIRPGVYRLESGNLRSLDQNGQGEAQTIFTREELMRKYGFTR